MKDLHWILQVALAIPSFLCIASVCLLHISDPEARAILRRWGITGDAVAIVGWFIIYLWGLYALLWFIPGTWGTPDGDEFKPLRLTISVILALPLALKTWLVMASHEALKEEMKKKISALEGEIEQRNEVNREYYKETLELKDRVIDLEAELSEYRPNVYQKSLFD